MAESFLDHVERRQTLTSLRDYFLRALPDTSPIIVFNRAPYDLKPDGTFTRGSGGVITALLSLAQVTQAKWVACARTPQERALAVGSPSLAIGLPHPSTEIYYANPSSAQYDMFYSVIANPLLWFIQHYLWDLARAPLIDDAIHQAWAQGYVEVNRQIAERVVEIGAKSPSRPLILVHDYQLYLVPALIRAQLPGALITHFIHIPWPTPQYWKVLPHHMRDGILRGLLGCDLIGFQSKLDARNFLLTCEMNANLHVDAKESAVLIDGRVVYARAYPISIDTAITTRLASSRGVAVEERKINSWRPSSLIVRIDRTDPSKNILRGFLAYEILLLSHPELKGQVQFWAFLQSSRQDVALYRNYLLEIRRVVVRINSLYSTPSWLPIRFEIGESQRKALAALRNYDVLLVNPIYDGLNLVSKEGALVNTRDGVIVLSENAGAHEELSPHVLSINPFDIEATALALYRALTMDGSERKARAEAARAVVRDNDLARWIARQIEDLRDLLPSSTPRLP